MTPIDLRTLRKRYAAHLARREHSSILRPGQMRLGQDILNWMHGKDEERETYNTESYFVRPTGAGKTVSLIDVIVGINSNVNLISILFIILFLTCCQPVIDLF